MLKLNIIALGAGGIKTINSILPKLKGLESNGLVKIQFIGIDGSNSVSFDTLDKFYIPKSADGEDLNGSGGDRAANYEKFKSFAKALANGPLAEIITARDGTINVIISSLGGGSGAMLANAILPYFMVNKGSCFYIGIADYRFEKEANSTYKQLATIYNLPRIYKQPLVFSLVENKTSIADGNKEVLKQLILLIHLASGENYNLDTNDVAWVTAINRYKDVNYLNDIYLADIYTVKDPKHFQYPEVEFTRVLALEEVETGHATRGEKSGFVKEDSVSKKFLEENELGAIVLDLKSGIKDIVLESKERAEKAKIINEVDENLLGDSDDGILL